MLCASIATTRTPCGSLGSQNFTPGRSTSMCSTTTYAKEAGVIDVEYVPTEEMAADCLTKPLKRQKFIENLRMVGLGEDTHSNGNRRTQPHAEWECCK